MTDDLRRRLAGVPALGMLAGLATGIFCAVTVSDAGLSDLWLWLTAALLAVVCLWLLRRRSPSVLAVAFFSIGIVVAMMNMPRQLPADLNGKKGILTGRVVKVAETEATVRYVLTDCRFDTFPLDGVNVNLTVNGLESCFPEGTVIAASGYLRSLNTRKDIPFEPDYGAYARVDGVTARMITQTPDIRRIGDASTWLERFGARGRSAMRNAIIYAGFSEAATTFALAVLAGDDSLLDVMTRDRFRTAGIAHVLALSGLHVGILVCLAAMLLFGLRCLPAGRLLYYAMIALTVLAYALMTGLSPSVARAATMTGVFCLARITGRRNNAYNALFVSVAMWLLINPLWLWSPGLQLSFVSVLSILWLGKRLVIPVNPETRIGRVLRTVITLIVLPVAALTGTSMLTIIYFHSLPLWFLPVNVIASLIVPVLMVCFALCAVTGAVGLPVTLGVQLTDRLYSFLDECVAWFASLPSAQITGLYADWWQVLMYLCFIGLILIAFEWKKPLATVASLCMLAILITSFALPVEDGGTELYIPATYKSTDVVMRTGHEAILMTDGDEDAENAIRRRCAEWLERRGCKEMRTCKLQNSFTVAGRTFTVADCRTIVDKGAGSDYLLVTGSFSGDVVETARVAAADTVLLSAAIHPRRRKRFATLLNEASIPVQDISVKGFAFSGMP